MTLWTGTKAAGTKAAIVPSHPLDRWKMDRVQVNHRMDLSTIEKASRSQTSPLALTPIRPGLLERLY